MSKVRLGRDDEYRERDTREELRLILEVVVKAVNGEEGDSGFLYTLLCDDAVIEELHKTDLIKLAVQPSSLQETNMIDTLNSTVQRAFRGSQAGGEVSKLASMIKQKRGDFLSPSEREGMQQILKAALDTALGENHDISDTMRDHLLMDKNILKATKACKINAERNDEAAYVPAMHNLWMVLGKARWGFTFL